MLVIAHRGASAASAGEHRRRLPRRPRAGRRRGRARRPAHRRRPAGRPPRRRPARRPAHRGRRRSPTCPATVPASPPPSTPARRWRVNVEIKNWPGDPDFDPTEARGRRGGRPARRRGELDDGRVLVSSLQPADRRPGARARRPACATGWLLGLRRRARHELVGRARRARPRRPPPPPRRRRRRTSSRVAHAAGLAVNTWTVDDPARIRGWPTLGVDGIITNVPDVALAALGRDADVVPA